MPSRGTADRPVSLKQQGKFSDILTAVVSTMVTDPRRRHPRLRPTRVSFIQVSLNKS
jgi:hypothetical protein